MDNKPDPETMIATKRMPAVAVDSNATPKPVLHHDSPAEQRMDTDYDQDPDVTPPSAAEKK